MDLPVKRASIHPTPVSLWLLLALLGGAGMALVLASAPLLVSLSFLTIGCSFWLMQKAVAVCNPRALTIPGFCYLYYLAIVLFPAFFVYADNPGPYRLSFLFAVESALLTIPLGLLFANVIFRFDRSEATFFFQSPTQEHPSDPSRSVYVMFLGLAWIITALYLFQVRTVPLFYMIAHPGEGEIISRLREESMKLLDSPLTYTYVVLGTAGYRFLIVLAFGRYLQTKQRWWGLLLLASTATGLLYEGFTVAKAPVAATCLVVCAYYYLHRKGRVGTKFVAIVLASVLVFPLFVLTTEFSHQQDSTFLDDLQAIFHRMFYATTEVLYYWFEVFPHVVPYQHGKTIGLLAKLMGEQPFDASNVVGRYMRPHEFYSVSANAGFVGNLNADFGMVGVLLGGFCAGLLLQGIHIYLVRRGKSVMTMTIYAILMWQLTALAATSLPATLLSNGPIFVLLLAWSMTALDSAVFRNRRMANNSHYSRPWLKGGRSDAVWPRAK